MVSSVGEAAEKPCDHIWNFVSLQSAAHDETSLILPATTMPKIPRSLRRAAIRSPISAHVCPGGCCITTTLPGAGHSVQCMFLGRLDSVDKSAGTGEGPGRTFGKYSTVLIGATTRVSDTYVFGIGSKQ